MILLAQIGMSLPDAESDPIIGDIVASEGDNSVSPGPSQDTGIIS